jgi:2-polyprenyl-3-methyl-5-hydroxy-6-metoxy-1,4-benzoquinol methylase
MTAAEACIVCGSNAAVASRLRADLVECRRCGLIYRRDRIEDRSEFGESYFVNGVYADYTRDREAVLRSAARRLHVLERAVHGRRLLDVGCAAGYFLEAARARGWDACGLDLSRYASTHARSSGLDVYEASILAPPDLSPFDVITLWDTIEHVSEPSLALTNARRLLRPGGVLAISTGDCRSAFARLLGRRWRLLADPTHRFFFDEATLSQLLRNVSLRTVCVSRPGKWVPLSMVLHQLPLPGATHIRRAVANTAWNPPIYVNLGDVMTMLAEPAS